MTDARFVQGLPRRVEVDGGRGGSAPWRSDGPTRIGSFELESTLDAHGLRWTLIHHGASDAAIQSIGLVFAWPDDGRDLRMFRQGLQSWSETDVARFGVDRDPSYGSMLAPEVRATYQADPEPVADASELRSEWVTVLGGGGRTPLLVGFEAGTRHEGTIRLRRRDGAVELVVEAFLGGALLVPGVPFELHPVVFSHGDSAEDLLVRWAERVGRLGGARTSSPYLRGYCTWYHYFERVREEDIRTNLALARDFGVDVFQIDDGHQRTIGDWLTPSERFPSGIEPLVSAITAAGMTPGIWLAPFLVAPDSEVFREHPEWVARRLDGSPHVGMWNPAWDGGMGGLMFTLDTTRPNVLAHLESVARALVERGFGYLKLDFTYAPRLEGLFANRHATPAERVRAGYEAIRRGAGEQTFILGCGAPLAPTVGLVDGMRIGPDVAPSWEHPPRPAGEPSYGVTADDVPGYAYCQPATRSALQNTVFRSFMHRQLWANDPDCVMLRPTQTKLTAEQRVTWARAVGVSGGLYVLSDDLSLLGSEERAAFEETIALGHASDEAARHGTPATTTSLLEGGPLRLTSANTSVAFDLDRGTSERSHAR